MKPVRQLVGAINGYAYQAQLPATRPATDYTARLIPYHDAAAVPLEDAISCGSDSVVVRVGFNI